MAKNLSRHGKLERLEADGITHRRDCECARCEAGFTPTEHEREVARRRAVQRQGRLAAARALERRREAARLRQQELATYFAQGNEAATAEVQRLRALRAKVVADERLDELLRLRRAGVPMAEALAEVDRRGAAAPSASDTADNDNARGAGAAGDRQRQASPPAGTTGNLFS